MSSNGRIGSARFNNITEDLGDFIERQTRDIGRSDDNPNVLDEEEADFLRMSGFSGEADRIQGEQQARADAAAEEANRQERIKNVLEQGAKRRRVAPGIKATLINPMEDTNNPGNTLITIARR